MRTVGTRKDPSISMQPSGELLREACAFNEMLQNAFPYGKVIAIKKGVYRFKTHEEANRHQEQVIVDTIVLVDAMRKRDHE